jgi:hypothetical protein
MGVLMAPWLKKEDAVPVTPLREFYIREFNRGNVTPQLIAERLGMYDRGRPDETKVLRMLGLRPVQERSHGGSRVPRYKQLLSYQNAARLAEAMGMDYHEAGV